jgi:hypothetical protein
MVDWGFKMVTYLFTILVKLKAYLMYSNLGLVIIGVDVLRGQGVNNFVTIVV